ncbi:phospholipid-transporting ATPase ID [Aplysia californica]|uniref:Phospholipid-transporting ATPase n=1 Tax=Aplysia californica TaxID=6500 RepID=A0ABM0K2R0_APLCA|nr:phospholipid-transporting ATPase ID [Aplysia californica]
MGRGRTCAGDYHIPFMNKARVEIERNIKVNNAEYNAQFEYADNYISTSKYNIITFLPKNLFEQFQRLANAYFLGLLVMQLIPAVSSLEPVATIIPLVFVLSISAIKEAIDDFQRHRSDDQVNNRRTYVLRNEEIVEERWHKVKVGDIILLKNNDYISADLLLLSTSEPHSLCYIETAELDGETNLKVRQALEETAEMGEDLHKLAAFDAEIVSEPPNNRLSKFEGKMMWKSKTFAIDNEKILLRGCILRNTQWCYGLVVFAGRDTKLMMNSGKTKFKRTNIDRLMNLLILGIFAFLLTMCLICTVACGIWETMTGHDFQVYLPWESFVSEDKEKGATTIAVLVFLSYIIILNTVVPISLYVSVEIIRLAHSLWINWDVKMYYEKSDTPAKARTTTLNEELGQIEYIFSDKTGTLTQNIMTFNKCSINGRSYGDPVDAEGNALEISENTPKIDLSWNPYAEKEFEFYDSKLVEEVTNNNEKTHLFFTLLALCHTVMAEFKEDDTLEYQAQSPDEGALVGAARNFGFVFKSRTPSTITIEVLGQEETYELLCILDFNNVRKRMSVIVRKNGKVMLFSKGADTIMFDLLSSKCDELKELTTHHLNDFAQTGLRTLVLAYKEIDISYFDRWLIRHHEASTAMEDRDGKLDAIYEEIEQDMILIGATAIEDKLQDGVPETIANLALAGIKIWVLTGDKQETAINIGYSCRLLTDEMEEPFIIDGESMEEVESQMKQALEDIDAAKNSKNHVGSEVTFRNGNTNSKMNSTSASGNIENGDVGETGEDEEYGEFALVINGHSLAHALKPEQELTLLNLGCMCKAVICCRVTPLQKALVVDLVKRHKKSITLSIGDGANDVSMIKVAHIGIGISGQEGMQAVLASDYSISQFKYLERLLLVHGRWSYLRMCKFLRYFFYKNFAFTLCHFWFAFFCGFSAQTLFDPYFISLYNVFYTSLPILVLGIFDQDVDDHYCIQYPKLYEPGMKNALFNKKKFSWSVTEGVISSLILFFLPYGTFRESVDTGGMDVTDTQSLGTVVAAILVVTVNLRCALDTSYWTGFNHFTIWGSIIYYFCFHLAFYSDAIRYKYSGVALKVFGLPKFWLCLLITSTLLILPMVAYRFYMTNVTPTLSDRVRFKQGMKKSKSRTGRDLRMRRQSTIRRSTRSMRSGYAFAHQAGFGELITSGLNMKERVMTPLNVVLTKVSNWAEHAGHGGHHGDSGHHSGTRVSTHEPKLTAFSSPNASATATVSDSLAPPKKSPTRSSPPAKHEMSPNLHTRTAAPPPAAPPPAAEATAAKPSPPLDDGPANNSSQKLESEQIIFVERL